MLHTDRPSKNALVYDVMEPAKAEAEVKLLPTCLKEKLLYSFITSQVFGAKDFMERTDGSVTVSLALRRKLSQQSTMIARLVTSHTERVAGMLAEAADSRQVLPALLTQANRSSGRSAYRTNARKTA